jgi:WD40 repeat-containing protein SMU1
MLRDESKVLLQGIDHEAISYQITNGRWGDVLRSLQTMEIPMYIQFELFELIFLELLEKEERATCRRLLTETTVFAYMRSSDAVSNTRFRRLESLLIFDSQGGSNVFGTASKVERRTALVDKFVGHLSNAPSSRLLNLIRQAVLAERNTSHAMPGFGSYDLMLGKMRRGDGLEPRVSQVTSYLRLPKGSYPETVVFSPDGNLLVSGSSDGLIEVYETGSGKLAMSLEFQRRDEFMAHESSVTAFAFSRRATGPLLLASGDKNGEIRIWKFDTGALVKSLTGHRDSITSLSFSSDDDLLLSASLDKTAQLFGVKSGVSIQLYRGHSSFVTSAVFHTGNSVITSCSDGFVRVFDSTSGCLSRKLDPIPAGRSDQGDRPAVLRILPGSQDTTEGSILCSEGTRGYELSSTGECRRIFEGDTVDEFVTFQQSPKRCLLYFGSKKGNIWIFDRIEQKLLQKIQVGRSEVCSIDHHPRKSSVVVASTDGTIYFLGR